MPTSTTVNDLKINKLTEAQYDAAVQSGIIGENELSIITDLDEAIQVSSLPMADASELGKIYQYIGATDSTYTNAYFYKCVSDGQSPATYSWEAVEVQEAGDSLPDQTGNAGKFLTTDGTDASWSNHFSTNVYMNAKKRFYFNNAAYVYTGFVLDNDYIGDDASLRLICPLGDSRGIVFNAGTNYDAVAKIYSKGDPNYYDSSLGTTTRPWRRVYTWKLSNGEDISVPKVGGKLALQTNVMPTAASTNEGVIYQFTGTTDSTYTNGYFYKCVSDGQSEPTYSWEQVDVQPAADPLPSQTGQSGKFLTTDGTGTSWSDKPLVNTATGTKSISVMTATATGDGAIAIGNNSSNYSTGAQATRTGAIAIGGGSAQGIYCARALGDNCIAIGPRSTAGENGRSAIAIGETSTSNGNQSIAIGLYTNVTGHRSVLIGSNEQGYRYSVTENDTMYFQNNNGHFKLLNSNGTIPTDRFTSTPVTAGTYSATITVDGQGAVTRSWATVPDPLPSQTGNAGKVLATDGTTAYWKDISTSPSTMPQLLAANWSSNTQTVNVTGVTANNVVMVSPSPVSATEYAQCGILCTAQAAGTLTFTCTSVPTNDLTVNVVCF